MTAKSAPRESSVAERRRCGWSIGKDVARTNPTMIAYHDDEWGVPVHDDRKHFEFLVLDAVPSGTELGDRAEQAGWLSPRVRRFRSRASPGSIAGASSACSVTPASCGTGRRSRHPSATPARSWRSRKSAGHFDRYIWQFVGGRCRHNAWRIDEGSAGAHRRVRRDEQGARERRGFKFVGSTICYAYMQAAGMVNDHAIACFRHAQLRRR